MNVSMQDSYNLVWKIGLVAKGLASAKILPTYQSERRSVAQELINFDHRFSRLFSGKPAKDAADAAGISMSEFKSVFQKGALFATGLSVDYGASILIAKELIDSIDKKQIASKLNPVPNAKLGFRFPSAQVLNQSSAAPVQIAKHLTSDGRFRIILFAGNLTSQDQFKRVEEFCKSLTAANSFLHRFTPQGQKIDSVIEILTIHSGSRTAIELLDLPDLLHPFDEQTGWDYEKVFVDDVSYHEGHGEAYNKYGVDKEKGAVVVLRPDQHVAWAGELEDVEAIDAYFSGFMISQM
jgi:phenol 2-monooxygenase (NADPH)